MKVLIIQLRQLGDVLLSTPLAEAVKKKDNSIEVHFLTLRFAGDIVSNNPFIDRVLFLDSGIKGEFKSIVDIRKQGYDAVIDVQRTGRSKRITLLSGAKKRVAFFKEGDNFYYNTLIEATTKGYTAFERLDLLRGIGIENPQRCLPRLFFDGNDSLEAERFLERHALSDFFVVAPVARKKEKMWNPAEFGKLANRIYKGTGSKAVVVYGSERERDLALQCFKEIKDSILIDEPFKIKVLAALLSKARLFVGNDSFPAHVAVSQNTKSVIVCGPTSGWFLENEKTKLVYKGLKCQPCNDYNSCTYNFLCYRSLNYSEVFEKIKDFIY